MELREKRKLYGKSQKNVAEYLGISVPTYIDKEKGRKQFTVKEKMMLENLFSQKPETTTQDGIHTKYVQLKDGLYEVITVTIYRKIHD